MGTKWSSVSVSGYKAATVADDGTASEANRVKYSTIYTDLTDPIKTALDTSIARLTELFSEGGTAKSANYTTVASDHNRTVEVSSSVTITLLAASSGGAGYKVFLKNAGSGAVSIAPSGADTIDGAASYFLGPKNSAAFVVNAAGDGYTVLGAGGGLDFIGRYTASGATSLDIETGIDSTKYNGYMLSVEYLYPNTNAQTLSMRLKTGGAYATANYSAILNFIVTTATTTLDSPGETTAGMALVNSLSGSSTAANAWTGTIWLQNAHSTTNNLRAHGMGGYVGSGGNHATVFFAGVLAATTTLEGVRFFSSSGNITAAVCLYGMRKG